jgi:hypothetical protein
MITMKACDAAEDKTRKKTMLGSSKGSSRGAPPKYRIVYMPLVG